MSPKKMLAVAACAFLTALPSVSHAIEPIEVLNENFNNIATLSNWSLLNNSVPAGQSWFQGNPGIFAAQAGPPSSYIAANYLSAQNGVGSIDNWLITPLLSLLGPSDLSFYARSTAAPGFSDVLEIRISEGGSTNLADFTLLGTIGATGGFPTSWQQFVASVDYEGPARFAFRYVGDAAASNYIGLDSVLVTTVPEPVTYLMLLVGLGAVAVLRRKHIPGRTS